MRKIKFRAFDKFTKKIYKHIITIKFDREGNPNLIVALKANKRILSREIYDEDKIYINDFILLEYAGLKDKNSVEIYECNIIQIPDNYNVYGMNAGEKYEVYYAFGSFRLKPKYSDTAKGFLLEESEEIEVIGNIYENPELLETR